ncbi:hypothetical protein N7471_008262 [Penicillium samsonianum]|uniref:uncharacterized protein n=1 Tax=Penicillium samsonianum TaxID=1882272 RepID=UPI0025476EAA|nr:uncharacterized protein N7471_008262 [Penicillium samsonianum]KAJ6133047.1 hypothetical protein N7471_008262 [Penicillium samsonianum]
MTESVRPWSAWFTSATKPYLKIKELRPAESRPKIATQPKKTTFSCREEYTVRVGFSLIFEHEYATQQTVDTERKERKEIRTLMKMFTLPSNNRFHFAYIKIPESFVFKENDNFDIRPFHARSNSLSEVRAVIIEKHHLCPNGWATARMSQSWNPETSPFISSHYTPLLLTENTSLIEVERHPSQDVLLKQHLSPRPFEQQINAMFQLYKHRESLKELWQMLLSGSFKHFHPMNLYGKLRQDLFEGFKERLLRFSKFNSRQLEAFQHLHELPGPFALIQGPPGTGKTYWLLRCLLPFVNENIETDTKHQLLIVIPTNDGVCRTAKDMHEACLGMFECRRGTKQVAVVRVQHLPGSDPSSYSPQDPLEILNSMIFTEAVLNFRFSPAYKSHSHSLRANSNVELTYAHWMLRISGIIPEAGSEPVAKYRSFRESFEMFRNRIFLDEERRMKLCRDTDTLLRAALQMADVIVCTPFTAGHPTIVSAIKPAVVGIDEAAKNTEPEMWPIFSNYHSSPILMVGDHYQLGPTVTSGSETNPFVYQLRLSLFKRLINGQNASIMLEVQHRMHPDISKLVNRNFYQGRLTDHESTSNETASFLRNFNKNRFGVETNLLFVDVCPSEVEISNYSKKNEAHASVAVALCKELLGLKKFSSKDIIILVPYEAQFRTYLKFLALDHRNDPSLGLDKLPVKKIDSFQGGESPIVIFDMTVTTHAGFLDDKTRLNVALSRARNALYVVGNIEAMRSSIWSDEYERRYATLIRILDHISKAKLCVRDLELGQSAKKQASARRSIARSRTSDRGVAPRGRSGSGITAVDTDTASHR